MARVKKNRISVNQDVYQIIGNYRRVSTIEELRFDLLVPLLISVISVVTILTLNKAGFLELVKDLNTNALAVMSILAGFNTASLAVVSSSNPSKFVSMLSDDTERVKGRTLLDHFLSFFSYAIFTQLFLLVVGLIGFVLLKLINIKLFNENIIYLIFCSIIIVAWLQFVLHALFVTIRNVTLLYRFIKFLGDTKE